MREIKFRAWDLDKSSMVGPFSLLGLGFGGLDTRQCRAFNFMQFTGLRDKNGKEIYEGDIVQAGCDWNLGQAIISGTVVAKPGYYAIDGHIGISHRVFQASDLYSFEVFGNIYENPELLKESV